MKRALLITLLCAGIADPQTISGTVIGKPRLLTLEQRVAVLEIENKLLRHELDHVHNTDIVVINQWLAYFMTCFKQVWGQVPEVMQQRDKTGDKF